MRARAAVLLVLLALCACAPRFALPGPATATPRLLGETVIARDGTALAVQRWGPDRPRAVLIALHGFNDYANAFAGPAAYFGKNGIATVAYDQRGFGRTPVRGRWPGEAALIDDLSDVLGAMRARYPDTPFYVLGESMGAAVVIAWARQTGATSVRGLILSAPAVWGWRTMNLVYRSALWTTARLLPGKTFTGSGLKIWPSDNIEMLRGLARDPLVIKATRTDAIYGLVTLMDDAFEDTALVPDMPMLVLYGKHDQIVPRKPVLKAFRARQALNPRNTRFAYYPEGYHMLLRDRSRRVVWDDILAWMADPKAALPSGAQDEDVLRLNAD